jgi:hypothetical protein
MTTKLTEWCKKFGAVVFTSLVAPVLVNLAVRDVPDETGRPEPASSRQREALGQNYPSLPDPTPFSHVEPQPPQQPPSTFPTASPSLKTVRVIARGVGRTPEAALRDALYAALRQVMASQVDALTWSQKGPDLCAGVLWNGNGVLVSWRNLETRKHWSLKGMVYQEDVAVEVNLNALADRLRSDPDAG